MVGLAAALIRGCTFLIPEGGSRMISSPRMSWMKEIDRSGVDFVNSFTDAAKMPFSSLPEITLVGRSNVGKSSALNALCGRRKDVALVSKTPGRTRLINLFTAGKACMITDLPGYGFAQVSAETTYCTMLH